MTAPDNNSPRVAGNMRRGLSRLAEPYVLFPLVALMILAFIWGTTYNLIRVERTAAHRAAATTSLEILDTYEAQVVRALREIDQALKLVKFAYEKGAGSVQLGELRGRAMLPPDLIFAVSIADTNGNVFASTRAGRAPNVAGEDFFRRQRAAEVFAIGWPQLAPGDKEWKLSFSRRLNAPNGAFAGVAIVTVPAAYFVSGYEPAKMGERGMLGVLGADGVFRARRTGETLRFGEVTDYASLVPRGERLESPTPVTTNAWDGTRRFTSARELFEFPVAVVVGLSEDEYLAPVNERIDSYIWRALGGSALLLAFLAGVGYLSWQLTRMRATANRQLREEIDTRRQAEAALRLRNRAIDSSINAILIMDVGRQYYPIDYANPAFEKITGYSAAEAIGRNIGFLVGGERDQHGMQEIQMALRERREGHAVLRNYRKDGSLFWNDFHIAPVRDEEGNVTHFVGVMNDVTEAKTYEEQLARQANFDTLTGLANRNLLQDRLHQAIATAKRSNSTVAAVFLDVDNFKLVNDTLGHNLGDELLQRIAARLKSCVRETDTVARLGGDEFVLLLVNPAHGAETPFGVRKDGEASSSSLESDITLLMHKLLTNISHPLTIGGRDLRPTCSIGVSVYPQDGDDADALLRNADAAMYRAKELGRNRYQFFTADVHERIRRRMELESSLRFAIEREEFELFYQPQVSFHTGQIVGVEALLRWRHPHKGLVEPSHFIGFAEESGLINPIGTWVLQKACAQAKAWQDAGLPAIPVAVNMSAKQCERQDIDLVVQRALKAAGLAPQFLELEITESISMANPEQSVPLMERLKQTGVNICIDDFGTGFSNLSYLKRFPVDRLKIDISFVREIATDAESLAIAEAIITMSHSLDLEVVAEGVETEAQLELLAERDCDILQGYYFSRPLTAEAMGFLLREDRRLAGRSQQGSTRMAFDDA